jgi:uncharacterized protein DUF4395
MRQSEIQFVRSQGFTVAHPDHDLYVALMFQPRTIAGLLILGIVLQRAWLFLGLSAVLYWATLVPTRNLFDAAYNHLIAYRRSLPPIPVAPAPRRFAQAIAATVALIIGAALLSGATVTAWLFEALFALATTSVVVGRLCAPANLYLRLTRTPDSVPSVPRHV